MPGPGKGAGGRTAPPPVREPVGVFWGVWGCGLFRHIPFCSVFPCLNFNSRSREGAAAGSCAGPSRPIISIHAPAKGATKEAAEALNISVEFQFTPPARGGDLSVQSGRSLQCYFNSRPREGGRQQICSKANCCKYAKQPRQEYVFSLSDCHRIKHVEYFHANIFTLHIGSACIPAPTPQGILHGKRWCKL